MSTVTKEEVKLLTAEEAIEAMKKGATLMHPSFWGQFTWNPRDSVVEYTRKNYSVRSILPQDLWNIFSPYKYYVIEKTEN